MKLELPEEAVEFGTTAEKAFAGLGGVDMARRAEVEPDLRHRVVAGVLDELGIADLDPRSDLDSAVAAGELCRVAGRNSLPYPVVAVLLADTERVPLALTADPDRARVDHGDLFPVWRVATVDAAVRRAQSAGIGRFGSKLGTFVCDLDLASPAETRPIGDIDLHLTLTAWRILGTVERAVELAVEHVRGRHQFGQALAVFQAVQFQLADAAVAVDGLRELCHFTLWRLWAAEAGPAHADALAVRLHAIDVARAVLRTCQQLHGAAGVCDEYDISILTRHVQSDLRLPFGAEHTAAELVTAIGQHGFDSLFPHGGSA
jgi:hypothetical protein